MKHGSGAWKANAPCVRMRDHPLRSRWTDSPVSARSGASAMSERGALQTMLMVSADGQNAVRADEDSLDNAPLAQ
eukprot:3531585-Pyramimonas_sp.AAC.1